MEREPTTGRSSLILLLAALADTHAAGAQDSAAISRRWLQYIASKQGLFSQNAATPNALWSASEQKQWPLYDLAGMYITDGSRAKVLSIQKAGAGNEYRIVTRFTPAKVDTVRPMWDTAPVTMTVDAVREGNQWVFSNALVRNTRAWRRETFGPITYVIQPGYPFDSARARRAQAFVDSVAVAFSVPRPDHLTYFLLTTVDAALNALGVESPVKYGAGGGFAKPANNQLFSGDPRFGEEYRHELVHVVLLPLFRGGGMTLLGNEGVATWLGGTSGMDFATAVRGLQTYLDQHPAVTLDTIIEGVNSGTVPLVVSYPTGALLCKMVFESGGMTALKDFLAASDVRTALLRLLKRDWPSIVNDWRRNVAG